MYTFKIWNIDYALDAEIIKEEDFEELTKNLPQEITVEIENLESIEDELKYLISEKTGASTYGFKYQLIEVDGKCIFGTHYDNGCH